MTMPYDTKDPRSGLTSASAVDSKPLTDFADAYYAKFYETDPEEISPGLKTWYVRGQNLIVAYTEASGDTILSRAAQPDEYILLLPDRNMTVEITTDDGAKKVGGYSITIIPPGKSGIKVLTEGRLVRLFTVLSEDLARQCSNASTYKTPQPNITLFNPWPDPEEGYRLRSYSLDVPPEQGRFGRIWRCSTIMVNYLDPQSGPRDPSKMSPHSHDDFEQYSLALEGEFVHHIRWPWITNMNKWIEDAHEKCDSPSVAVIPPPAIHTTQAVGSGINQLVDIFCPPRMDFSIKPGWVLNAEEYPMP
jgi:hypothetical protein